MKRYYPPRVKAPSLGLTFDEAIEMIASLEAENEELHEEVAKLRAKLAETQKQAEVA